MQEEASSVAASRHD